MFKLKRVLIFAVAAIFVFSALTVAAETDSAIDILYSNGVVRGDGNDLTSQRYITYGEFAAITGRIFEANNYEYIERAIGPENWEHITIESCGSSYTKEQLLTIKNHFYDNITTEFATELILTALKGRSFSIYTYYMELEDFGYRTEIIPDTLYLTREQACEMICEMLYLEFPQIEDYDGSVRYVVHQYTLDGVVIVYVQRNDVTFKALVDYRPERTYTDGWNMSDDIRSKTFLENNICLGMERKTVEALIGKAYRTDENVEHYYCYYFEFYTLNNGNIQKASRTEVMDIRYENDTVINIEFRKVLSGD